MLEERAPGPGRTWQCPRWLPAGVSSLMSLEGRVPTWKIPVKGWPPLSTHSTLPTVPTVWMYLVTRRYSNIQVQVVYTLLPGVASPGSRQLVPVSVEGGTHVLEHDLRDLTTATLSPPPLLSPSPQSCRAREQRSGPPRSSPTSWPACRRLAGRCSRRHCRAKNISQRSAGRGGGGAASCWGCRTSEHNSASTAFIEGRREII